MKTLFADIAMDDVTQLSPSIDRSLKAKGLGTLDGTIERHPAHHFRQHVMLAVAAALPDSAVRVSPDLGQMLENLALDIPSPVVELQLGHARLVKGVHQFAIDVQLQLGVRGVADPA